MGNESSESETITIKKDTLWKFATVIFALLFILSIYTGGFGIRNKTTGTGSVVAPINDNNNNGDAGNNPSAKVDVSAEDDAVLGNKNAPVTIIEFSDYQCPFCGRHFTQTYPQLKKDYVDTGKIKIVFRDFPLNSIHPNAQKAAEASECAEDQGKFWEMHDTLFENQQLLGIENLKGYAKQLGLNENEFNDCLDSGKYSAEVSKDTQDAASAGGIGTPFFVVGGTPLSGAQPFSSFQQVIEAELAK